MADRRDEHRLVLWDIDHTLIETRGVGKRLYVAAFETVTGRDMTDAVEPTGRTELAIFGETLERHGIEPSDELRRRYAAELARQYEEHADELRTVGRALPGARAVLAALAEQATVVQTVLTGNLRAVAATKLRVFGLDEYVDWAVGAYGEDASERAERVLAREPNPRGRRATARSARVNATGVPGAPRPKRMAFGLHPARCLVLLRTRDSAFELTKKRNLERRVAAPGVTLPEAERSR